MSTYNDGEISNSEWYAAEEQYDDEDECEDPADDMYWMDKDW